jgi:hypothetical protein
MFLNGLALGSGIIVAMIVFVCIISAFCLLRDRIQALRFWGKLAHGGPRKPWLLAERQKSSNAAGKSNLRTVSPDWLQVRVQVAYKGMTLPLTLSDEDEFSRFV